MGLSRFYLAFVCLSACEMGNVSALDCTDVIPRCHPILSTMATVGHLSYCDYTCDPGYRKRYPSVICDMRIGRWTMPLEIYCQPITTTTTTTTISTTTATTLSTREVVFLALGVTSLSLLAVVISLFIFRKFSKHRERRRDSGRIRNGNREAVQYYISDILSGPCIVPRPLDSPVILTGRPPETNLRGAAVHPPPYEAVLEQGTQLQGTQLQETPPPYRARLDSDMTVSTQSAGSEQR